MLVNKKILADVGITDPTVIKDYNGLLDAAKKVTAKTGKPSVNISSDDLPDWFSQALIQGSGEKLVAEDGSVGFDTPNGRAAVGILSQMAQDKLLLNVGLNAGEAQFTAGNLAFNMDTTSRIASIGKAAAKDLDWMPIDLPGLNGAGGALPAGGKRLGCHIRRRLPGGFLPGHDHRTTDQRRLAAQQWQGLQLHPG